MRALTAVNLCKVGGSEVSIGISFVSGGLVVFH